VLITSRRRLKGLDDAYPLPLDVLPNTDATTLLRTVAGAERFSLDDPALAEITELCGRLPLALRIAGALLRHRPTWAPEHLAELLRDLHQRVHALSDGERDLGAAFDLSYGALDEQLRLLFRRLGLVPGPDLDAYATAALTGTTSQTATRLLEDLVDHNLLIAHRTGRYRLHDLLRAHARALGDHDPAHDRQAALDRLLDYYHHTAGRADALVTPYPRPVLEVSPPAHAPALPDQEAAWAWLRTERPNLLAALSCTTTHTPQRSIGLTASLATLLRIDGPLTQAIILDSTVAGVAEQAGDRRGQADALTELGNVRAMTGDHLGAMRDLREALRLYQTLGERRGQATALGELGQKRFLMGDYAGGASDLQKALELHRDLGDRHGQASTLAWLGQIRQATGDYPAATGDHQEALRLYRDLGDRRGQANILIELGQIGLSTGDYPGAARDLQAALDLHRDFGHQLGQASALAELGNVRRLTGDFPGAVQYLEAALELYRRLGYRGNEAWALNHYAAAIAATGNHTRALNLYLDALRLARETRQPDDEARALEGIGDWYLRTGDTEAGTTQLRLALDIFQRLTLTPDTDRVQARLTQLTQR
jgi:tetratricopeptide (TPR) repeat protein